VWTSKHQMSLNGKRDNFLKEDLIQVGKEMGIKSCNKIINEIVEVVSNWSQFAKDVGIDNTKIKSIGATHRLFNN
jgi:serine/threonine-protein kinase HipA